MKKRIVPFLLLLVLLAAIIAEWFLLPDPVLVDFRRDGKTMPKLLVLALTLAISVFGAVQAAGQEGKERGGGYIMMLIAAALAALTLGVNLL